MQEITATDAARNFADLLNAVEHDGLHFTVVRRGRAVATLQPVDSAGGAEIKALLRRHSVDSSWRDELTELRELIELDRP